MWRHIFGWRYTVEVKSLQRSLNINKKNTAVDHSGKNTVLQIKVKTFEWGIIWGIFFINSTIIFFCKLYVNIFYVKYRIQVSAK